MQMLRLVLHNQINQPIFLEIAIDEGLKKAISISKVTKVDFVFYEKNKAGQIVRPDNKLILPNSPEPNAQINKFKLM